MPSVPAAIAEIYDNVIRNAVYHSDYTVHEGQMRLMSDYRLSKKNPHYTQVVEFDELEELFNNAFAFYSALFQLYERCRGVLFNDFKSTFMPFDSRYNGLMEFVFDDADRLRGYRTYWPNGSYSEYTRTDSGCTALNLVFRGDEIDFMVGLYASNPSSFSPLVERCGTHLRSATRNRSAASLAGRPQVLQVTSYSNTGTDNNRMNLGQDGIRKSAPKARDSMRAAKENQPQ